MSGKENVYDGLTFELRQVDWSASWLEQREQTSDTHSVGRRSEMRQNIG